MTDTDVGAILWEAAAKLAADRYPTGWAGAAALRTAGDSTLTSIAPEVDLDALHLCIETGAILEAHKLDDRVTHALCIYRPDEGSRFRVLTPCGVCQERLRFWGDDVRVAVSHDGDELRFSSLGELGPHNWREALRTPTR